MDTLCYEFLLGLPARESLDLSVVVTSVRFFADDGEIALGGVECIRLPGKSGGRNVDLRSLRGLGRQGFDDGYILQQVLRQTVAFEQVRRAIIGNPIFSLRILPD
jgi:hypothetical protein